MAEEKGYVGEEKKEDGEGEGGETSKKKKVTPKLLLVDPDKKSQDLVPKVAAGAGVLVENVDTTEEALEALKSKGPFAIIMTEQSATDLRAAEILSKAKKLSPFTVRVLTSSKMDVKSIEESINLGEPFRFLRKPFDNKLLLKCVQESLRENNKNITTASQLKLLEKLSTEFKNLKTEGKEQKSQIASLKKSLRTVIFGVGMIVLSIGGIYGVKTYLDNREIEDASVKYGAWVLYPNRTALDTSSGKTWMSVDFRNIEKRAPKSWNEANEWILKINEKQFGGFSDWRLPTLEEYKATYDPNHTKMAFEKREDYKVGYPLAFEDGGGYGYWSSTTTSDTNAGYFFFIGGYDKMVPRDFTSPAMSVRLVRGG